MNYTQTNRVLELNMDLDEKNLSEAQSFYFKNREFFSSIKNGSLGLSKAVTANEKLCDLELAFGENYRVGSCNSELTNEVYVWIKNTDDFNNFIYRITGANCEVVYSGYIPMTYNPSGEITQFRVYIDIQKTCRNWGGKRLIWTDGRFIGSIDVEASIATNSFSTPFFDLCSDPMNFISLCVPSPCGCLSAEYLPITLEEKSLPNKIAGLNFQFMYRFIYYDGRKSDWSDPSTMYFQKSGCFENDLEASRCMKVRVPIGNANVEHIELAYRNDNGNAWFLAERIKKYKSYNNNQQQWYERELSELIAANNFSEEDCSFDYIFCNDKQCIAIDLSETLKIINRFPREAQGLIPFGESIAFYNYKKGNCPIPQYEIDKLNMGISCVEQEACPVEYITLRVRLVIHVFGMNSGSSMMNQFIWKKGDTETEDVYFGGLHPLSLVPARTGMGQMFTKPVTNFIAYVEGTSIWSEMKQYNSSDGTEVGIIPNMSNASAKESAFESGGYYYQEAEIRVRKGQKGFIRIASHKALGNEQNSSTNIMGLVKITDYVAAGSNFTKRENVFEIPFDTCNAEDDTILLDDMFIVRDNDYKAPPPFVTVSADVYGYITDCNGNPVEGATVKGYGDSYPTTVTDHNGYYNLLFKEGQNAMLVHRVYIEKDCSSFYIVHEQRVQTIKGQARRKDIKLNQEACDKFGTMIMKVVDCDGNSIAGIKFALSGSKPAITNSEGEARWRVWNYQARNRRLTAILLDSNGCFIKKCNGSCEPCSTSILLPPIACYAGNTIDGGIVVINTEDAKGSVGLKAGGDYGFGFVVKGDCGNISFVNKSSYINIPRKKNDNSYCIVSYDFTGVKLPAWAKCVSIVRTKNLSPFLLQWVVDKVEYVNGKVRLTIQSLNDYNFQNFFKTKTVYQYAEGDFLQFIKDGDGVYYTDSKRYKILSPFHDTAVSGRDGDTDANFFNQLLIEDDGRAPQITEGAVIELSRPKVCEIEELYFTICHSLEVIDGEIINPVGVINTFDTFLVNRSIGGLPAGLFEHFAPDDYTDPISDIGNVFATSDYADEYRFDRNLTVSEVTDFARFGDIEKTFDGKEMGGIIGMSIHDNKVLFAVCERDNFRSQKSDGTLVANNDGTISVAPANQIIANPDPRIYGKFGCDYGDVGSIFFGDGFAFWFDMTNSAFVFSDYQNSRNISFNQVTSWLEFKISQILKSRLLEDQDMMRMYIGYNYQNKNLMVTVKSLRDSHIDDAVEPYISRNETIAINVNTDSPKFLGFLSFTPNGYAAISSVNQEQVKFVTFMNGEAWAHYAETNIFNEFYGVACDTVFGIVINKFGEKIKIGIAVEIQSGDKMWFCRKVTTDDINFLSEIPPAKFKQEIKGKWNASFLFNKNDKGGLFANQYPSKNTRGYHIKCIFVRDNTVGLQYGTIDNNKRVQGDELDQIITKFALSEQSGMTENL